MKLTRNTLADKPIVEYKGQRRFIYPTVSKSIRSESPRPDAHQLPPLTDPYQNDDSLFTTDLQINWSNLSAVRLGISDADVVKSSLEGCIHLRGFT